MDRTFVALGALLAGIGVALGAFGAHALRASLSAADLATFETGVRYQMYHSLGLFVVAWAGTRVEHGGIQTAGWLFAAGVVLFSGSLYALVLSGQRWLGAVTPLGGVCFLAGWTLLAWSAWRGERGGAPCA